MTVGQRTAEEWMQWGESTLQANTKKILRRVQIALEDKERAEARRLAARAIAKDERNFWTYLMKMIVDSEKANGIESLLDPKRDWTETDESKKAEAVANEEEKEFLLALRKEYQEYCRREVEKRHRLLDELAVEVQRANAFCYTGKEFRTVPEKLHGAAVISFVVETGKMVKELNTLIAVTQEGPAALQGDREAAYRLGRAIPFWKVYAAENNSVAAQRELYAGETDIESFSWYRELAGSQYTAHLQDDKIVGSEEMFVYWSAQAAARGDKEALRNLGQFYEAGVGVEPNLLMAAECYQKAGAFEETTITKALLEAERVITGTVKAQKITTPLVFRETEATAETGILWQAYQAMEALRLRVDMQVIWEVEKLLPYDCEEWRATKIEKKSKGRGVDSNQWKPVFNEICTALRTAKENVYKSSPEYKLQKHLEQMVQQITAQTEVKAEDWKRAYLNYYCAGLYGTQWYQLNEKTDEILSVCAKRAEANMVIHYPYRPAPVMETLLTKSGSFLEMAKAYASSNEIYKQVLAVECLLYHIRGEIETKNYGGWRDAGLRAEQIKFSLKVMYHYGNVKEGGTIEADPEARLIVTQLAEKFYYRQYQNGDRSALYRLYDNWLTFDSGKARYWARKAVQERCPEMIHVVANNVRSSGGHYFSLREAKSYLADLKRTLPEKYQEDLAYLQSCISDVERVAAEVARYRVEQQERREREIEAALDEQERGINALFNNDHLMMSDEERYLTGKASLDEYLTSQTAREYRRERMERKVD